MHNVRERLAKLASELSPDARTTARNADEPIPIFTWPRNQIPIDRHGHRRRRTDHAPTPTAHPPTEPDPICSPNPRRPAGQLVERWLPGGTPHRVDGVRSLVRRHRGPVLAVVGIALLAAIVSGVAMASSRPETEAAPALPAAVSAMANSSSVPATPANTHIVISVVGKVANPGLVTLVDGSRVADAVQAAGGVLPGTDVTTLNLARKLADGEQIYVGIPVPPGAAADPTTPADAGWRSSTDQQIEERKGRTWPESRPEHRVRQRPGNSARRRRRDRATHRHLAQPARLVQLHRPTT